MNRDSLIKKLSQIQSITNECLAILSSGKGDKNNASGAGKETDSTAQPQLDFSLPLRPFFKKYAGGLSGPKKFALLLAKLVNCDEKKEITLVEIEKTWNSMTVLMGMEFNRFFSGQAKDNGWVESKKKGIYNLRSSWVESIK